MNKFIIIKTSLIFLLLSAFTSISMADIIFDFNGNHPVYGKAKAELHLKNNYIFGSDITARNLIKLNFRSSVQHFTIYPKETGHIYAALEINGKLSNTAGNFQFYIDAVNDKFFGSRTDGTWRAGNSMSEGNLGRWKLRTTNFKHICLTQDNFHKAASRGDVAYVEQCLRSGIDVNRKEGNGWTALHSAASKGRINVARTLLRYGANRSIKDKSGRTAYDHAVRAKRYNMMAILKK